MQNHVTGGNVQPPAYRITRANHLAYLIGSLISAITITGITLLLLPHNG